MGKTAFGRTDMTDTLWATKCKMKENGNGMVFGKEEKRRKEERDGCWKHGMGNEAQLDQFG